jgi:hypothetical protein
MAVQPVLFHNRYNHGFRSRRLEGNQRALVLNEGLSFMQRPNCRERERAFFLCQSLNPGPSSLGFQAVHSDHYATWQVPDLDIMGIDLAAQTKIEGWTSKSIPTLDSDIV